ncbi:toxic anion resistance protein [Halomonas sp. SL1]|uniref:toxic anion resistance protein n=1 Tax=Halomonas sp. SL1 TaxID=2137478 RepID=UPI000D16B031|nr:toxic anion resistance protein [Halomonas sp. SL1]RAH36468.1 toxic anion resistance protein [Halomonas sp. SL1]
MTDASQPKGSPLSLPPVERIAEELERPAADEAGRAAADPQLAAMAEAFVTETLGDEAEGAATRQRRAVDEMGLELQQQAARQSEMLKTPLRQLARHGEEGGPVAKALVALRGRMDDLDPRHHRLEPGRFDRVRRLLPGASSRLQRYFHRFETAQQALEAIIADLQGGRDMLERDNLTLADDQEAMRATLDQLERQVSLGRLIDERLMAARDGIVDDDRRAFVEEELLFPLRQRILDLQQQQAVCQQGVLALEVIIRNNRELMRGVDRAVNVTVSALSVAATVALALANQRLVLDRVESLNATTSETIAGTARALRQQGVDIQTRAASANLDMKALEGAFADVMAAVDDLASYRREALPRLGEQIERLEGLTREGGGAVERLARESGESGEAGEPGDSAGSDKR